MKYDYIFTGLGLAAMMALLKMKQNDLLVGKRVLIIEPDDKIINDRTWCFWDSEIGKWDHLMAHKWEKARFIGESVEKDVLKGFSYKMIEAESFYEYYKEELLSFDVDWIKEKVVAFEEGENGVIVKTVYAAYSSKFLFNSVYSLQELKRQKKYPVLQQHFLGWFVEVDSDLFDKKRAVFMDFSVPQKGNTRFMYVLPFSKRKALLEYTLFSDELLSLEEYEIEIKNYLNNLGVEKFEVYAKEQGSIPMTVYPFWKNNTQRILNIGTAGGWTKASTGFTFKNVDKETTRLVDLLRKGNSDFRSFKKSSRFTFYDDLFVDVLHKNNFLGKEIFSSMFTKCDPNLILRFLDEETTFIEDVKVVWSCPKLPFVVSLFRKVFK